MSTMRRQRLRHRRLGEAFAGSGEFVAPMFSYTYDTTDSGSPGVETIDVPLPESIPSVSMPVDTSGATVSVQQLQQQQAAGVFANPKVPPQYSVATPQWMETGQQYLGPAGAALSAAQTAALKQAGMWSGSPGAVEVLAAAGLLPDGTAASTSLVPSTSPAATPATASAPASVSSNWLTNLLAWLQSPISPGLSIPWYWVLLAGGATLYLMREE